MINAAELELLRKALDKLAEGYADLPGFAQDFDVARVTDVIEQTAIRMQDNYPYHHPLYAGQMLKPPHAVARIVYAMSLWLNPNNHALDGGRASSALEKECVAEIGRMFGWTEALGHLAGGGTMANLEALWIAGRLHPGGRVLASSQAHYTHARISDVLGMPFSPVDVTPDGRMDPTHLESLVDAGGVGTIVATIGTTGLGAVDPLPDILDIADRHGIRVHADAAYGGYFGLTDALAEEAREAFDALGRADSIVIDPHKHGLQPYGCGCVLFRDPEVGRIYKHDSPYTYFSSAELHLGEISLECSRPGAAAVALWATQRLFPLERGGEFAGLLTQCLTAARDLYGRLEESPAFDVIVPPALDIVTYLPRAKTASAASDRTRAVFTAAAERDLHLAMIDLPVELVRHWLPTLAADAHDVRCLRSVLMKPGHADWTGRIVDILEEVAG